MDASNPLPPPSLGHTVPGVQVLQLVDLMAFWKIAPERLLCGSGLDPRALEVPEARVPIELMNALVRRARELSGEPALGVFIGLRRRVSMYGFLGFAAMNAATLGEALELAVRFSSMVSTAVALRLHVEREIAALRVEERCDPGDVRDVAVCALMIGLDRIGKALTGRELFGEAHFAIPRPAYADRFPELFAHVQFDRPVTQFVFEVKDLALPLVAPDRVGLRLAREQCERALGELGLDGALVERVRHLITSRDGVRSLEEVASTLHVSARTLKRRLSAQGISFSELLEQERRQRAQLLLSTTHMPLAEITERLGYSTLPNFARAFRRWTGQAPGAYRRAQRTQRIAPAQAPRSNLART